jgi:hypothetical protein
MESVACRKVKESKHIETTYSYLVFFFISVSDIASSEYSFLGIIVGPAGKIPVQGLGTEYAVVL